MQKDQKTGKFLKGHKKLGGRKKGSLNYQTRLLQKMHEARGSDIYEDRFKMAEAFIVAANELEWKEGVKPVKRSMNYLLSYLDTSLVGTEDELLIKLFRK